MRNKLRDNSLSITMLGLFLLFLIGQSLAGWKDYNESQQTHRQPTAAYIEYLGSGHFWGSVFENWESEFLQMASYVFLTAFLFQRGSSESKDPDKPEKVDEDPRNHRAESNAPWPVKHGGVVLSVYNHSLSLALTALFLLSFAGHAAGSFKAHNQERIAHGESVISLAEHVTSSHFWFESFQNWQSEFLAVGVLVGLSIWLREKNSPESKPVFSPHEKTGK